MFDEIEVLVPLPDLPPDFAPSFQTKSLVNFLDNYRIDADGVLWHEDYDIEDRSDPAAIGLMRFAGAMTRVPKGWSKEDYTGEVELHDWDAVNHIDYRYSTYFENGKLAAGPHRVA